MLAVRILQVRFVHSGGPKEREVNPPSSWGSKHPENVLLKGDSAMLWLVPWREAVQVVKTIVSKGTEGGARPY